MVKAGMVLLLFQIVSLVVFAGEVDLSRWKDPGLQYSISEIKSRGKADSGEIEKYRQVYVEKCRDKLTSLDCYLTEEDILPADKARAGHVLLFRGESSAYDLSSVSTFLRESIRGNYFCKDSCDIASVTSKLFKALEPLNYKWAPSYYFDNSKESWYGLEGRSKDIIIKRTSLGLLAETHFKGEDLYIVPDSNKLYERKRLDPLVSYSVSPNVSLPYAYYDSTTRKLKGRLIVLSVPYEKIKSFAKDQCDVDQVSQHFMYDLHACSSFNIPSELEINAYLYVPGEYVFEVYNGVNDAN